MLWRNSDETLISINALFQQAITNLANYESNQQDATE
jgi:hypothetical protein